MDSQRIITIIKSRSSTVDTLFAPRARGVVVQSSAHARTHIIKINIAHSVYYNKYYSILTHFIIIVHLKSNNVCSFVTPVSVISLLYSSTERWWNKVIRVEACFYIIKPAYVKSDILCSYHDNYIL